VLGTGAERTATISALEAAETLELRRADFEQLLVEHPAVQRFVLEAMAERLKDMTAQLSEALFVTVDKRVHRRLLFLHDLALVAGDDWIVVRQEEVAMMAGTTRPTVNRVLRRAQAEGVIELGRGRIRVLDRNRLARRAR
jgi:CRP-like cAMP-binding protein